METVSPTPIVAAAGRADHRYRRERAALFARA